MATPAGVASNSAAHIAFLAISLGVLGGCFGKADAPGAAANTSAPAPASATASSPAGSSSPSGQIKGPPVSVSIVAAQKRDFPVMLQATGTISPMSVVEVRSQLSSVITKVHFKEGQSVKKGEPLFTLDARTEEANVSKATGQLAKDAAALADAKRLLARNKELLAQGFISQGVVDTVQSQVDGLNAQLVTDQAGVQAAKVALSNARIIAPSAGRVGAVNVFAGSTVQAGVTTLVTITQLDPIAVLFNLPQRNLPDALSALNEGGKEVSATLPDGGGAFSGRLQFVDNAVDPNSGTVKVKAVFKNAEGKLWPSAFVNVSLKTQTLKDAVVIPQAAVIQGARGSLVYAVVDGKAVIRPVQVQYAQGLDAAVSGIEAGESIVLDGRQNLRPGATVQVKTRDPSDKAPGGSRGEGGGAGGGGSGKPKNKGASAPRAEAL